MLQDDPAFLPDFTFPGLDIDLSALDISTDESSRRSSILSPNSQRSSLSSHPDADESMLGLIIPSSNSGDAGDLGGFILPEDTGSAQRSARQGRLLDDEDEGFNIDPGFTIDADGNLIEGGTPGPSAAPAGGVRLGSDSAASGRVRQELLEGLQAGQYEV
jgi:meiotic recombination protein REC8